MKDTSDETRRQPSWRGAALAAAYGAIAAVLAYVVGRGNPVAMVAIFIVLGVAVRLYAARQTRRRGEERPPWWRWL
jgi:uncharacterized membrane protein YfcA